MSFYNTSKKYLILFLLLFPAIFCQEIKSVSVCQILEHLTDFCTAQINPDSSLVDKKTGLAQFLYALNQRLQAELPVSAPVFSIELPSYVLEKPDSKDVPFLVARNRILLTPTGYFRTTVLFSSLIPPQADAFWSSLTVAEVLVLCSTIFVAAHYTHWKNSKIQFQRFNDIPAQLLEELNQRLYQVLEMRLSEPMSEADRALYRAFVFQRDQFEPVHFAFHSEPTTLEAALAPLAQFIDPQALTYGPTFVETHPCFLKEQPAKKTCRGRSISPDCSVGEPERQIVEGLLLA